MVVCKPSKYKFPVTYFLRKKRIMLSFLAELDDQKMILCFTTVCSEALPVAYDHVSNYRVV